MPQKHELAIKWSKDIDVEKAFDYSGSNYEVLYAFFGKRMYRGETRYETYYIGKTTQHFSDRFKAHHALFPVMGCNYGRGYKTVVRTGELILSDGKRISDKLIKDVEAVLIRAHTPYLNVSNTVYYRGDRDIRITNNGNYKPLDHIIDTSKWLCE